MPPLFKQFSRFAITGSINAAIDFLVYLGLTRLFHFWSNHLVWATTLAFITANINSYLMNRYWTFQSRTMPSTVEYTKFFIVSIIGLSINVLIFHYLVYWFEIHDIYAKVIVAGIVLIWNFSINKLWTFRHAL